MVEEFETLRANAHSPHVGQRQKIRTFPSTSVSNRVYIYLSIKHLSTLSNLIPINSLDLSLSSTYDHAQEHFPDPVDPILQPETLGLSTWRRLRNSKFVLPGEDPRTASLKELCGTDDGDGKAKKQLACQDKYAVVSFGFMFAFKDLCSKIIALQNHPVLIGGIMERKHPSYVKLMNSSHHAPQTNAGFSRQTGDGNIFVY